MDLTKQQDEYREWLIGLVLCARTLPQIETTRQLLQSWVDEHPDDLGIRDGFDHLAMFDYMAHLDEADTDAEAATAITEPRHAIATV